MHLSLGDEALLDEGAGHVDDGLARGDEVDAEDLLGPLARVLRDHAERTVHLVGERVSRELVLRVVRQSRWRWEFSERGKIVRMTGTDAEELSELKCRDGLLRDDQEASSRGGVLKGGNVGLTNVADVDNTEGIRGNTWSRRLDIGRCRK